VGARVRPKDIVPLIFNVSRRKNRSLSEALWKHTWIRDLNLFYAEVKEQHIVEYCRLWSILQRISLQPGICDSISWKLSVTPGFKEQSRVHLIHAPKKTTYIITECIEINVIKHQSIYYIAEDLLQK
jgi:hypothetical protein